MRLEHHLVGGYVRYISPHNIIIIMLKSVPPLCITFGKAGHMIYVYGYRVLCEIVYRSCALCLHLHRPLLKSARRCAHASCFA